MLVGKRILVVEDEPIVAMLIEDMLEELGASAVGPVPSVSLALGLLGAERVDAAVLDVNLGSERSDAVANRLTADGIPFIFATGYGRENLTGKPAEVLTKPYRIEMLKDALMRALCKAPGDT